MERIAPIPGRKTQFSQGPVYNEKPLSHPIDEYWNIEFPANVSEQYRKAFKDGMQNILDYYKRESGRTLWTDIITGHLRAKKGYDDLDG